MKTMPVTISWIYFAVLATVAAVLFVIGVAYWPFLSLIAFVIFILGLSFLVFYRKSRTSSRRI